MDSLTLPPEAWVHVLSFVDADTIANRVGLVSHAFHALAAEPQLWRRLVLRDFPASRAAADSAQQCSNLYEGEPDGWRKTFYAHRWLERSKRARFCLLGHVDSGKSTLLGRVLLGLGKVTQQEVDRLRDAAFEWGKGSFMYAWCSDRTDAERQRGITIDWRVKECTLSSGREIEVVDVPGHRDFNKNAFIGASMADVAMLVVAAGLGEFEAGVSDHGQFLGGTSHHLMLAKSLGMSKVIVVVNKMDDRSINYSQARFNEIKDEVFRIAGGVGYKREDLTVVPISAWIGENVVKAPSSMPWYNGPMLFEVMEQVAGTVTTSAPGEVMARQRPVFGPTRVSVLKRVNKLCTTGGGTDAGQQKHEEVVQALVQGGTVREGQVLEAVLPTPTPPAPRRRAHVLPQPATVATFTVLSIQRFQTPRSRAAAGEYVGLRLRLEHLPPAAGSATADRGMVRRGMVLLAAAERAGAVTGENDLTERVECFTVRLDHSTPARLRCGSEPYFIINSSTAPYRVEKILRCWDKDGQEVKVAEASDDGKAPVMNLTAGMSTLLQVKPKIGGVCVEPFVSNAAMGTVLMLDHRRLVASGRIETVRQRRSEVIN